MQLRKICCHPFLFPEVEQDYLTHLMGLYGPETAHAELNGTELWRTAGKFELLDRVLPKLHVTGHRSLLFSQFTTLLNILEDYFRYKGIKYLRMDGACCGEKKGRLGCASQSSLASIRRTLTSASYRQHKSGGAWRFA